MQVEITQLQNKSKPVRKVAPIVSRSPMINRMARQRAQSHGSPNSHAISVITRFWPNQEVGRDQDGLGRLHVEDL